MCKTFTSECCDANSTTPLVENEYLDSDGFQITMIGTCELCCEIRSFIPLMSADEMLTLRIDNKKDTL